MALDITSSAQQTTTGTGADAVTTSGWQNAKGVAISDVYGFISNQTDIVNEKLSALKDSGESISITDMFEMQMKMNRLSQFSEMSTAVVSAAGAAVQSIARNVK